jgi:hypothetical protein
MSKVAKSKKIKKKKKSCSTLKHSPGSLSC